MTEQVDDPVEALFHQAVELPPGERAALLDAACRDDPGLRAEVESLLACDTQITATGNLLESPLVRTVHDPPAFGPPAAPGEVGTLGPYRVMSELGRGGMGAVYAAADTRLGRRLALKVMLPQHAADAAARERFLREARAVAQISHDNVVTVYEADERDGVPYIAMQFLEGQPLDDYLKKEGPPPLAQVLRIAGEAAAGLDAAHRIGLVHRDIKPPNLWLEAPHGRVKVLDFGLAKPGDTEIELTRSGAVLGTPAYMSPEQARGEKVDHRTDLFSLGAVLYRLCSGRLPFEGPTTMSVLTALATAEPPSVRKLNPAIPEPLAELIHQLLAKNPEARPSSAAEVVKRVRAIAEGASHGWAASAALPATTEAIDTATRDVTEPEWSPHAPDTAPKKRWRSRRWIAAGLVGTAAVVLAGVIIIIRNRDGTETKIEAPDTATVMLKDKKGKLLAQVGPENKSPAADADPDRKAAEWVLSLGGSVRVNVKKGDIVAAADLPMDRFTLTLVSLTGTAVTDAGMANLRNLKGLGNLRLDHTKVTDAGLVHLKDLTELRNLLLMGPQITDAGLAHLKHCKALRRLYLEGTKVTDTGLAHLKGLKDLTQLTLLGAKVTDAGLVHLKGHSGLTSLDVRNTKVTGRGLADFHATVPGCTIEHNGGVIEAKK